jgi:hypothetical protein
MSVALFRIRRKKMEKKFSFDIVDRQQHFEEAKCPLL